MSTRPAAIRPVSLAAVAEHAKAAFGSGPDRAAAVARTQVTGVAQASRQVRPGDLYVARPGGSTHGAHYVAAAEEAGAVAWMTDTAGARIGADSHLPCLVVDDPRHVLGSTAAMVYGGPAERLTMIGITGTQGKTTTTRLIEAGLSGVGAVSAVIGTMGTSIAGQPVSSHLTTPEAPDLHALFAVMVEQGVEVCAMEVSSHALEVGRVDGVVFDLAVFTNFGRDHLDFHETVEAYFAAKSGLFTASRARRGLINVDDPSVVRLLEEPSIELSTFSASGAGADWRASAVATSGIGSRMTISGPGVRVAASVALPGAFNVTNALCALAAIGEIGLDVSAAAQAIGAVGNVPGRMERVDRGQGFLVIVDYAHKPDALTAALEALRPSTPGTLTVVLGAGGNRDTGKRPLMGQVAASLADVVVVTDDNPRSEDPRSIRAQVIAGAATVTGGAHVREIGDRELAITTALREAVAGDTVVVAGKGHETGQEIAGSIYPFDDREVVTAVLEQLAGAGGPQ